MEPHVLTTAQKEHGEMPKPILVMIVTTHVNVVQDQLMTNVLVVILELIGTQALVKLLAQMDIGQTLITTNVIVVMEHVKHVMVEVMTSV